MRRLAHELPGWRMLLRGAVKLPDLATSAPPAHPDLGPGNGQERDDALAAEAAATTNVHAIHDTDPAPALDDVDAAIAEGRVDVIERVVCLTCSGAGWVRDPLAAGAVSLAVLGGLVLCPGCGGRRAAAWLG